MMFLDLNEIEWEKRSLKGFQNQVIWQTKEIGNSRFIHNFHIGKTFITKEEHQEYNYSGYERDRELEYKLKDTFDFGSDEQYLDVYYSNFIFIGKRVEKIETLLIDDIIYGKILIIRFFSFTSHIPKKGEIGYLEEWKRTYISLRDTKIAFDEFKRDGNRNFWSNFDIKRYLSWINHKFQGDLITNTNLHILNNKYTNIENIIKDTPCHRRNTKNQIKVEKYSSYLKNENMFPDLDTFKFKLLNQDLLSDNKDSLFDRDVFKKKAILERINKNLIVIHCYSYNDIEEHPFEYASIFVDEEGVYPCYLNNDDKPIINHTMRLDYWDCYFDRKTYDVSGTILESKLKDVSILKRPLMAIIFANKFLYFEQLIKIGYPNLAEEMYLSYTYKRNIHWWKRKEVTPTSTISDYFSNNLKTYKKLFKKNGFEEVVDTMNLILKYKIDLSRYNETDLEILKEDKYDIVKILNVLENENINSLNINILLKKILRSHKCQESKLSGYRLFENEFISNLADSFSMEMQLNNHNQINLDEDEKFKVCLKLFKMNIIYLRNYHNQLSRKINSINLNKYTKGVQKAIDLNQKWGYIGDTLSIVIPSNKEDIANEGKELFHCVGSYIPDVAKGNTFIVFLRKNDKINKPYYTIEIIKNEIIQIRGYGNKVELSKEDIFFLREWTDKKEINIREKFLKFRDIGFGDLF